MSFKLTKSQLAAIIPGNLAVEAWHTALVDVLPKYGITTQRRVAHFLSQCAHESNNFRSLVENLNYSSKSLDAVFGRYFGSPPKRNAKTYARKPEKIANYVYMDKFRINKMGNVQTGDGWLFRGRGLKQLTGRDNYTAFGKTIGMSAEQAANYVSTEKGAVESACWFWSKNNLNAISDNDDVARITKRINGGNIGLRDRQNRYTDAMKILGTTVILPDVTDIDDEVDLTEISVLRRGSRGNGVKIMQTALKITADGVFGPGTERKLIEWQTANKLVADGIAGPNTLGKLLDD